MNIVPVVSSSVTSGRFVVENTSGRAGSWLLFAIRCAPAGPRGKETTAPGSSSRVPSGVRNWTRPDSTASIASVEAYHQLDAFPEVNDVLRTLKASDVHLAVLSNGTAEMLGAHSTTLESECCST
jgi:hypothetical protein